MNLLLALLAAIVVGALTWFVHQRLEKSSTKVLLYHSIFGFCCMAVLFLTSPPADNLGSPAGLLMTLLFALAIGIRYRSYCKESVLSQ